MVLVDFDDTLVETAPAFQQAREALFTRLEEEGFRRSAAERVHYDQVEPELLAVFGMGPFRLEPSFRDTYLRLCRESGRLPDPNAAEDCGRLGRDFMGRPRVMDGALDALSRLSHRFPTVIYSQAAQPEYQKGRISDSGAAEIVGEDRVVITPEKTAESLRGALQELGVGNPARAVVVGNSLRSDINPALVVGAAAVLVEPYEMWYYDKVPPVHDGFQRFTTFPEAVAHLLEDGADPKEP